MLIYFLLFQNPFANQFATIATFLKYPTNSPTPSTLFPNTLHSDNSLHEALSFYF